MDEIRLANSGEAAELTKILKIVVLDDHSFRGAGIAAILSQRCGDSKFDVTLATLPQVLDVPDGTSLLADEAVACICVVGGASVLDARVAPVLHRCLELLEGRPLIILADEVHSSDIDAAITFGVRGLISTGMATDIAIAAIQFIVAGGHYFPHSVPKSGPAPLAPAALQAKHRSDTTLLVPASLPDCAEAGAAGSQALERFVEVKMLGQNLILTQRQHDVMLSVERGLSNKAIGRELDLSESTVKIHVRHLMRKLGVTNRTQIALLALTARHHPDH